MFPLPGPNHHQRVRQRHRRRTSDGGHQLRPARQPELRGGLRDLPAPHRPHRTLRQGRTGHQHGGEPDHDHPQADRDALRQEDCQGGRQRDRRSREDGQEIELVLD